MLKFASPFILVILIGCASSGSEAEKPKTNNSDGRSPQIFATDLTLRRIVRMDDMNGTGFTTFNGSGADQGKLVPEGIAVDPGGRVYFTDLNRNRIIRMDDIDGSNFTAFGTTGSGVHQFNAPVAIAIDQSGKIYIADNGTNSATSRIVRMDDMNGSNWTVYSSAKTAHVYSISVDSDGKIYFLTASLTGEICRIDDMNGTNLICFYQNGSNILSGGLTGVTVGLGRSIFFVEAIVGGFHRISKVDDMAGNGWVSYGSFGTGTHQFNVPAAIQTDLRTGSIYVADRGNSRIVKISDMNGSEWTAFQDKDQLKGLYGIALRYQ